MNPALNRFCSVYSTGCVPLLCKALTISEVIWEKGLNDTVNIYCTWQQTVLCKWRSSRLCAGVSVGLKKKKKKREAVMKVPSASHKIQPVVWILSLLALFIYCCEYCKVLISPDGKSQLHNDLIDVWNRRPTSIALFELWGESSGPSLKFPRLLFRHHIL